MPDFTRFLIYCFLHSGPFALIFPIFAFFAFIVGGLILESRWTLARLEKDGVPAVGEVTALRAVGIGDMEQSDVRYFVTCRFRVGEGDAGELVEHETKTPDGRWRSLRKGDAVAIRYSRSDPAVWDIPTGLTAADGCFGMWACFIAGSLSAIVFISALVAEPYIKRRWPELAPV